MQAFYLNSGVKVDQFRLFWAMTNGAMPLGAVFGALSSGFVADRFGR
jgi:hypothetical protein